MNDRYCFVNDLWQPKNVQTRGSLKPAQWDNDQPDTTCHPTCFCNPGYVRENSAQEHAASYACILESECKKPTPTCKGKEEEYLI